MEAGLPSFTSNWESRPVKIFPILQHYLCMVNSNFVFNGHVWSAVIFHLQAIHKVVGARAPHVTDKGLCSLQSTSSTPLLPCKNALLLILDIYELWLIVGLCAGYLDI